MTKTNMLRADLIIRPPEINEWIDIAELIADSIPNALVSKLGVKFGSLYYEHISKHHLSCSYAAFGNTGRLAGIVLGTLDHNAEYPLDFTLKIKLLLAANLRLLSPKVFRWILSGLRFRSPTKYQAKSIAQAQLKTIAVYEEFKGNGIAKRLINELETFFKKNNLQQPYLILTEKSNEAANKIYKKMGAQFIRAYPYHDKVINEWHKSL